MKTKLIILLAVVLVLPCCATKMETLPDGTVIVTKTVDSNAIDSGGKFVTNVAPWFLSK